MQNLQAQMWPFLVLIVAGCAQFKPLYSATTDWSESTNKPLTPSHPFISSDTHLHLLFPLTVSIYAVPPSHLSSFPPLQSLPVNPPHPNTGQIGKPWSRHRSWGRSYLSQTDQEVCDGGVDGGCRSVTLAGVRQAGPHGSGTVGLQTDGTWWVTNN